MILEKERVLVWLRAEALSVEVGAQKAKRYGLQDSVEWLVAQSSVIN